MNPLDQLADISTPSEVSIWPLAWGYWLAIAISIALVLLILVSLVKRYRLNKQKKAALVYVKSLSNSDPQFAAKIQIRLKQLCTHYFVAQRANMMHGNAWLAFVKSKYKGTRLTNLESALQALQTDIYAANQALSESETHTKNEALRISIVDWITKSLPVDEKTEQKPPATAKVNSVPSEEAAHV